MLKVGLKWVGRLSQPISTKSLDRTLMNLSIGDRAQLLGGYQMEPKWLHGGERYLANTIDFLEHSAALIEFGEELEADGFTGEFG